MADKEEKSIRVVDRRMFTADGELRPGFEPEESPAPAVPAAAPSGPAAPPSPPPAPTASSGAPLPPPDGPDAAPGETGAASLAGEEGRGANASEEGGLGDEGEEGEEGEEGNEGEGGQPAGEPRGAFSAIVRSLATTAYSALGLLNDPAGARHRDPAVARQMIDWLAILESKTRNNLSFEESDFLSRVLYELRLAFVEVTRPPGAAR